VSTSANDTLFKIETTDYLAMNETGWADMEFKTNGSNEFYGIYNNGSNNVIRVHDSGWPGGFNWGEFLGGTCNGGTHDIWQSPITPTQNLDKVASMFECIQSQSIYNDHYSARGDTCLGLGRDQNLTNKQIEHAESFDPSPAWMNYFDTWKCGPEILNGGSFSIASGDHIMINVKRQSVDYYKNGSLVHTQSNSDSEESRIGGVVSLPRKLIIGSSSNDANSTFTLKKIKWHGNAKSDNDALVIYEQMPLYDGNIITAATEWVDDPTTAEAKYGHISNWDVSQVTNMKNLFSGNKDRGQFNEDISNWDTSNVTDMTYMFLNNTKFNLPIGNWDTSKVVKMTAMFYGSDKFNQPLNDWDVSSVTHMKSMFLYSEAFNQPLDQWNVSSVTTIQSMFGGVQNQFNQDISMWDVSNIISAGDPTGLQGFGNSNTSHSSDLFRGSDPLYFTILQS
tara:strand:- start:3054 stop:4403 length:1350 start_codon:yes stop_codon:yes gene_type:complete